MTKIWMVATLAASLTVSAQERFAGSADLDAIIEQAIKEDQIPGAVLLAAHKGKTLHRKAYGRRALEPRFERMTLSTIFDAASLTKIVATSASIMKLFEEGKIRLNDPVVKYLPEFQDGRSGITVRHLLTHFSGLRPDVDLHPVWSGYDTGVRLALIDKPVAEPGARFIYSDINFILLGEMVRRLGGEGLDEYARRHIFLPLGMTETRFRPPASLVPRIAPTERVDGRMLRGIVHDPTTRYMGGVAGHAGLFTTARDLSRFAQMLLDSGRYSGKRIFSPLTVQKFTTPQSPADQPILRGLGFDIDSPFSGNRGDLFPLGSYGHTGFTGTSVWIDPASRTYVVLLANSVHPKIRPAITSLRARVATTVAAALGIEIPGVLLTGYNETLVGAGLRRAAARNATTATGLDVLAEEGFGRLKDLRVGLITNHTGLTRDGRRGVDAMLAAGINVAALFSPEHGISGREDHENVGHSKDEATGIRIWSLYEGKNRRPNEEMMGGVDAMVFDIQDIGARFYTYMCTMVNAMEEAARRKIPFYVLDRPNPITGTHVEGPMLDPDLRSFVGCVSLPIRHGMTLGEIAALANAEQQIGSDLRIVHMRDWQRGDWMDTTGLTWINPSPNMRSLNAALLYPGVAMLESARNYSVGRGTDAPFEQIGADWIDGAKLANYLNKRHVPGVRVYPVRFRPTASNFAGKDIEGVRFVVTGREAFNSVRLGMEIGAALEKLFPGKLPWDATARLIGNKDTISALRELRDPRAIESDHEEPLRNFLAVRDKYLLYR
jgi:uncharacterized protein YbbC (DUF1343 family)/CubicO group peptidase (beta-lactamase class C family)